MKLDEIILHIGLPKTGTTSIQNTLYSNRDLLMKHGYLYPSCWNDPNHRHALFYFFNSQAASSTFAALHGLQTAEAIALYNHKNLYALKEEIAASNCNRLILSAESISADLSLDDLKKLQLFFRDIKVPVKVICLVRDPIAFAVSMFQQRVSSFFTIDQVKQQLPGILNNILTNKVPSLWEIFGKENVKIVMFEKAIKSPEGLVRHFIKAAGLPAKLNKHVTIMRANTARSMEVTELLDYFNKNEPVFLQITPSSGKDGQCIMLANTKRYQGDRAPLFDVPGTKFDLPFELKEAYFAQTQEYILFLKENVGIDYTDSLNNTSKEDPFSKYAPETIAALEDAFPRLSSSLKPLFLDFFEQMYHKTGDAKFLPLFQRGSLPEICAGFTKRFEQYMTDNKKDAQQFDIFSKCIKRSLPGDSLKIFFSVEGESFSENRTHSFPIQQCPVNISVSLDFDCLDNIQKIRLDPSLYPCVILIRWAMINGKPAFPTGGNFSDTFEGVYTFLTCDPQLLFDSLEPITKLEIEISVEPANYALSFCIHKAFYFTHRNFQDAIYKLNLKIDDAKQSAVQFSQELSLERERNVQLLFQEREKNTQLNKQIILERENIQIQKLDIEKLNKQVLYYQNSRSWKLTRPLRWIIRVLQSRGNIQ